MKDLPVDDVVSVPYEEEFNGFIIYIDDNPDRWCGGYVWAVCKDDAVQDSGLEFSIAEALRAAYAEI